MSIPTRIRVFGKTFEVGTTRFLDSPDALGRTHKNTLQIEVIEGLPPAEELDVVLHECIHALCYVMAAEFSDETEERIASVLGSGLAGLFLDNPKLLAYVATKCREAK